jgi:hypothetical protein
MRSVCPIQLVATSAFRVNQILQSGGEKIGVGAALLEPNTRKEKNQ